MGKPFVGRAVLPTWVAMMVVGAVSGSVLLTFGVGVAVYPFCHLAVKTWGACKSKQGANCCKRTGVRGWF